jgi:hypothetical protein
MRWLDHLEMKWSGFAYNYRWSIYTFLFEGWIAKCAMGVPIIGYLILFNDSITEHLSFNHLANENSVRFGLSSIVRLKLIYLGLVFLGVASIVYRLRRPFVMHIGTSQFDYVERALNHFTVSNYINMNDEIRMGGHKTLHGKYYDSEFDSFLNLALGKRSADSSRDETTADWGTAKTKYEGLLRSILIENFFRNIIKRRIELTCCIFLALTGYALLLIPSLDLFAKVMNVILGKHFA